MVCYKSSAVAVDDSTGEKRSSASANLCIMLYNISAHLVDDIFEIIIQNFDPYTFNGHLETYHWD
ncbi:hypothetical protein CY34DRAFT_803387 [Suillus luteus UH-Slu-Lm8-n1]|uniref:Uncharacterized protein n=1 Tax=Suillus luteus UH-Slu-Lm8-n1 TaxID=930992 RepID=A0A0D0BKJ3_9AGAM|nr:hypothetical protein CY34DRAFT_803387 [Suillus luteus UH-Slu-Lm8-n1]